jgi:hypothetical protein
MMISRVGSGNGVKVGSGVGLGVSVGGTGVFVGMASWVIATIVHAAASAVPCTSCGDSVGVPCGPQAVRTTASSIKIGIIFLIIFCVSIYFLFNSDAVF